MLLNTMNFPLQDLEMKYSIRLDHVQTQFDLQSVGCLMGLRPPVISTPLQIEQNVPETTYSTAY